MITRKDLAPIDDKSLEIWRNDLKYRKDESLTYIYIFEYDSKKRLILSAAGIAADLLDFRLWKVEEASINYIDNIAIFRLKE